VPEDRDILFLPDMFLGAYLERLTELQRSITAERYEGRVGRSAIALIDRRDTDAGTSQARLPWQADDIDGVTQLDEALPPGTIAEVAASGPRPVWSTQGASSPWARSEANVPSAI